MLERLRLEPGQPSRLAPSPTLHLLLALACVLMVSLARNYAFVLVMLAIVLVRMATLPGKALAHAAGTSIAAAAASAVLMLPSLLLGQGQQILVMATKVLVSVGIVLCTSLTIPNHELTEALRTMRVPSLVILTLDLTLRSIVTLGTTAHESLTALRLRSVGRNRRKGSSIGGVGGVTLLKASRASEETFAAMRCRGFEGDYPLPQSRAWRKMDPVWALAWSALVLLFVYLQKAVS